MREYDLVIRNATVIDGTRAPRYDADIFVSGGRIAAIGRLPGGQADAEGDGRGRIAAPGFIDAHTHDDRLMLSSPEMAPKVSQGVTTVVAGNCGCSLAPAPNGMPAPGGGAGGCAPARPARRRGRLVSLPCFPRVRGGAGGASHRHQLRAPRGT